MGLLELSSKIADRQATLSPKDISSICAAIMTKLCCHIRSKILRFKLLAVPGILRFEVAEFFDLRICYVQIVDQPTKRLPFLRHPGDALLD